MQHSTLADSLLVLTSTHLWVTELHQAGTATRGGFLSARSKPMCILLCGHWMAANCPLVASLHVFSTARQAQNSIASSMTIPCFPSHFHPNTIYWQAWVRMVLYSYGTQNHVSHLASHFPWKIAKAFTGCHSLQMGGTWHMVDATRKLRSG